MEGNEPQGDAPTRQARQARSRLPLPERLTIKLIAKVGEPLTATRTTKLKETFNFEIDQGFCVFHTLLSEKLRAAECLDQYQWNGTVFIRPKTAATQTEYHEITEENWIAELTNSWNNAQRTQNGAATYQTEIQLWISEARRNGRRAAGEMRRRATAPQIQAAVECIEAARSNTANLPPAGEMAHAFMAQDLARQPDDAEITVPNNATFSQMVQLDMQMIDMQTRSGSSNQSIELDVRISSEDNRRTTEAVGYDGDSINDDQHEQEMESQEVT
ncbi:hypothetical protein HDU80_003265, partial [Chytriomyces hyalinus]